MPESDKASECVSRFHAARAAFNRSSIDVQACEQHAGTSRSKMSSEGCKTSVVGLCYSMSKVLTIAAECPEKIPKATKSKVREEADETRQNIADNYEGVRWDQVVFHHSTIFSPYAMHDIQALMRHREAFKKAREGLEEAMRNTTPKLFNI